jgi:hypothetical protein
MFLPPGADSPFPQRALALERQILGVGICHRRPLEAGGLRLWELGVQRARQMGDDLVLHLQQLSPGGVELFGPEVGAAFGINKLGVDPDLIAARLDRAFEHVANAQVPANSLGVDRLAPVRSQ